jgi:hypothetical protein
MQTIRINSKTGTALLSIRIGVCGHHSAKNGFGRTMRTALVRTIHILERALRSMASRNFEQHQRCSACCCGNGG